MRVKAIRKIDLPRNKFEFQYFVGRVNFLGRFIDAFAEIVKQIAGMMGKDK